MPLTCLEHLLQYICLRIEFGAELNIVLLFLQVKGLNTCEFQNGFDPLIEARFLVFHLRS